MKIEVSFKELDRVLEKMGIQGTIQGPRTVDSQLEEGITVTDLTGIKVAPDGTFTYKDRKIIVYIRDQFINNPDIDISDPENLRRFHIANCRTLQRMQSNGRYQHRYVLSTRKDGNFIANIMCFGEIIAQDELVELLVCRDCLSHLGYNGFTQALPEEAKMLIVREFPLREFLDG